MNNTEQFTEDPSQTLAMSINWKAAPRWAKYVAQCADGIVVLYENPPKFHDYGGWWFYVNQGGRYMFAGETLAVAKEYSMMVNPEWAH